MKRVLLLIFSFFAMFFETNGQSILVNRFFNSGGADGAGDVVELVVVTDGLDIRNWIIKDYGNSVSDEGGAKYRFKDVPLWSNLKSGTTIVIRRFSAEDHTKFVPDIDATDFKIDISIDDVAYFTNLAPAKLWNLTAHEAVLIRADVSPTALVDGADHAVHALGYGNLFARSTWNAIKSPKSSFSSTVSSELVSNSTGGYAALTNPDVAQYAVPVDPSEPLVNLPSSWKKQLPLMDGMPYGVEVYRFTSDFSANGGPARKMNAYTVIVDPRLVEFKPTASTVFKTPEAFAAEESGDVYACLNGGFFYTTSLSMIRYQGSTSALNVASLNRSVYNNTTNAYYPTRATFGLTPGLKPDVTWTYAISGTVYSYSAPSPNDVNSAPQPIPTEAGGVIWNANTAIGGSPMLVKDGEIRMTAAEELAELDNTSLRARSAIGYFANGRIALVAVEGGNTTTGVSGLTLLELAQLMKEMGCVGAINLDGGGSTALRVNGVSTVRPSNVDGAERTMPGVILIKAKN